MPKLAPGIHFVGAAMRQSSSASISRMSCEQLEKMRNMTPPTNPVIKGLITPMSNLFMGGVQKGIEVEKRTITGPAGEIPLRLYTPTDALPGLRPLVVYFHGGGWVLGTAQMGDWMCSVTSRQVDAVVVSVDYRLAPWHKFPAGLEDCYAALKWCSENAASLGADASRIGVMGESAGGNLAAVVCLLAKERGGPAIKHQALLYPVTDGSMSTKSYRANQDAILLTASDMKAFYKYYLNSDTDPLDWRVSPLYAPDLTGLPTTIVLAAGHDPLHDEAVLYAEKLKAAGVAITLKEYLAMPHGFLNFPHISRDAKSAFNEVIHSQQAGLQA